MPVDEVRHGDRRLVAIRHADMPVITHWRNSQLKVLRQREPLTPEQQERYYQTVILPSYAEPHPRQILFSYLLGETMLGYGGLVHMAWEDRRAELSFLLNPDRVALPDIYRDDFAEFLRLIKVVAFQHLQLMRLFTETYDVRPLHVQVLEASGFEMEGRLRANVWIDGRAVDSLMHGCLNPLV